jgi:AcrR family transcriptional regulator
MASPETRTPDRRQRKSRAALQQALLTLIASKPYDAITIDDVTATADVARATFYAHYRDKATLLEEANRELIQELTDRVDVVGARGAVYTAAAVLAVFEHAREHSDLYRLVISGAGGAAVRSELVRSFEASAGDVLSRMAAGSERVPRQPLDIVVRSFVGGLLLTVESWLAEARPASAQDIAVQFLNAQAHGVEWSLGFALGEMRLDTMDLAGSAARQ